MSPNPFGRGGGGGGGGPEMSLLMSHFASRLQLSPAKCTHRNRKKSLVGGGGGGGGGGITVPTFAQNFTKFQDILIPEGSWG